MIPLDKGHHWMREEVSMPEVYRKFDVVFSKDEIKAILSERVRALVLTRKDVKRVELETVAHVEGEAIVTLLIGHKDIA
jgi:hypothetical protein